MGDLGRKTSLVQPRKYSVGSNRLSKRIARTFDKLKNNTRKQRFERNA